MRTAASERLADLIRVAEGLQLLLDGEGQRLLPGLVVARVAGQLVADGHSPPGLYD
jgi:hypothetical protein